MASINGISVKGMKKFRGHEGEPVYQGNLYLGGKKLGFWSQDSWGGCDRFDFDTKYSKELLDSAVKALNPEKAFRCGSVEKPFVVEYDLELLLGEYIVLSYDEKEYKKAVKEGYGGILLVTDECHITTWKLPKSYTEMSDEALLKKMDREIKKATESFFKNKKHTIKIYRTFDDFNIGAEIPLADIKTK